MRKESFLGIFFQACRLSFSHPLLFAYSFFLLLPFLTFHLFVSNSPLPFILKNVASFLQWEFFLPLYIFVGILITLSVFGKGHLIILLDRIEKNKKKPLEREVSLSLKSFFSTWQLLCAFLLLYFLSILLLSMPVIYFWVLTHELSLPLSILALVTFLPITFVLFVIEEFSCFYILLSRLEMRSALENSSRLFLRHSRLCLTYSFLFFVALLIFTFCFNLGMLGITAVLQRASPLFISSSVFSIGGLVLAWWFIILKHAFYLTFFKDIASPEEDPVSLKEDVLLEPGLRDLPPA